VFIEEAVRKMYLLARELWSYHQETRQNGAAGRLQSPPPPHPRSFHLILQQDRNISLGSTIRMMGACKISHQNSLISLSFSTMGN
jgi:hypothetical protein